MTCMTAHLPGLLQTLHKQVAVFAHPLLMYDVVVQVLLTCKLSTLTYHWMSSVVGRYHEWKIS